MAEETLFTDIINNLGKAKKEGKLKGGYRFADDGKLKLGGGYYDDDKMFEIEVGKDNANVIFKKRFADGGSTNGSADKAFTGKVKEDETVGDMIIFLIIRRRRRSTQGRSSAASGVYKGQG